MARNRKNQSAAIRFGPAIKAFLLCAIIGGSGVGYVWQKSQIAQLDQQIKQRELRLGDLKKQNKKLQEKLAEMHSALSLETRIKELNLGLIAPPPSQVWRLSEPGAEPERQFAQQAPAP